MPQPVDLMDLIDAPSTPSPSLGGAVDLLDLIDSTPAAPPPIGSGPAPSPKPGVIIPEMNTPDTYGSDLAAVRKLYDTFPERGDEFNTLSPEVLTLHARGYSKFGRVPPTAGRTGIVPAAALGMVGQTIQTGADLARFAQSGMAFGRGLGDTAKATAMGAAGMAADRLQNPLQGGVGPNQQAMMDAAGKVAFISPSPTEQFVGEQAGNLQQRADVFRMLQPEDMKTPYTPAWFAAQIAGSVPQMAATVGTAMAGAAVGGPVGAFFGAAGPTFFTEGGQEASAIYAARKQQGATDDEALADAFMPSVATGLLNAGIEIAGPEGQAAKNLLGGQIRSKMKQIGRSVVQEGGEEMIQGTVSDLAQAGATGVAPNLDDFLEQRLQEGIVGGVMGGGFGAGAAFLPSIRDGQQQKSKRDLDLPEISFRSPTISPLPGTVGAEVPQAAPQGQQNPPQGVAQAVPAPVQGVAPQGSLPPDVAYVVPRGTVVKPQPGMMSLNLGDQGRIIFDPAKINERAVLEAMQAGLVGERTSPSEQTSQLREERLPESAPASAADPQSQPDIRRGVPGIDEAAGHSSENPTRPDEGRTVPETPDNSETPRAFSLRDDAVRNELERLGLNRKGTTPQVRDRLLLHDFAQALPGIGFELVHSRLMTEEEANGLTASTGDQVVIEVPGDPKGRVVVGRQKSSAAESPSVAPDDRSPSESQSQPQPTPRVPSESVETSTPDRQSIAPKTSPEDSRSSPDGSREPWEMTREQWEEASPADRKADRAQNIAAEKLFKAAAAKGFDEGSHETPRLTPKEAAKALNGTGITVLELKTGLAGHVQLRDGTGMYSGQLLLSRKPSLIEQGHRESIVEAIASGKITSHPDYPELSVGNNPKPTEATGDKPAPVGQSGKVEGQSGSNPGTAREQNGNKTGTARIINGHAVDNVGIPKRTLTSDGYPLKFESRKRAEEHLKGYKKAERELAEVIETNPGSFWIVPKSARTTATNIHEPTDTIAGRMTLDEFEAKGYTPDEVTRSEWVEMQRKMRRSLGQSEQDGTAAAPYAGYEEYHRDAVKRAVDKGEEVDDRVLKDYPEFSKKKTEKNTPATPNVANRYTESSESGSAKGPDQSPKGPESGVTPGGKSESVAESLARAERETNERKKRYRDATSKLPDGTTISAWVKTTIEGDVFWHRGVRTTTDILDEAGQKAVDLALGFTPTAIPSGGKSDIGTSADETPKWGIYQVKTSQGKRFAVRQSDKKGGFGDTLHKTEAEARQYAADEQERDARNTAFREKEASARAEKDAKDAAAKVEREDLDGFTDGMPPFNRGRAVKVLNALATVGGSTTYLKSHVRGMVKKGNLSLSTSEEPKIQPMSRTAYHRASQAEQDAHEKKMKEAGTKTVYRVNGYDLGKTAYDYAKFLQGKNEASSISDSEMLRRLQSVENKSNGRGYEPLSEGETAPLLQSGMVRRKDGKLSLTDSGRSRFNDLRLEEKSRSARDLRESDERAELEYDRRRAELDKLPPPKVGDSLSGEDTTWIVERVTDNPDKPGTWIVRATMRGDGSTRRTLQWPLNADDYTIVESSTPDPARDTTPAPRRFTNSQLAEQALIRINAESTPEGQEKIMRELEPAVLSEIGRKMSGERTYRGADRLRDMAYRIAQEKTVPAPAQEAARTPTKEPTNGQEEAPQAEVLNNGDAAKPASSEGDAGTLTAAQFRTQLEAVSKSKDEADALYALVEARAEAAGETVDEYVGKRLAGVVKGGKPGDGALDQESPEFRKWFGSSKVVDASGKPLVVYHGTQRPDRIGNRFRASRATSGPMAFFTDDPEIAGGYAKGKADTSLDRPDSYVGWFKFKPKGMRSEVDVGRMWHHLPAEERQRIADTLPHVSNFTPDGDEMDGFRLGGSSEYGLAAKDHWDWTIKQHRGNVLAAAVDIWLDSGSLFDQEGEFQKVLQLAGVKGVRFDDPSAAMSATIPVYLSIVNPFDTGAISESQIADLQKSANKTRVSPKPGADQWDKRSVNPQDWMRRLREDAAKGTSHAWTSVPDWVTAELRRQGHDGIKDTGGKGGGDKHTVWIPFDETQVKSATGNRGTYDASDPNILNQDKKNLIVVHNLTADNIRFAEDIGGLAMPSVAVSDIDAPISGFGEISLVAPNSLIDPKKSASNKVYDADVYSPRYPSTTYRMKAVPAEWKQIEAWVKDTYGDLRSDTIKKEAYGVRSVLYGLASHLDTGSFSDRGIDELKRDDGLIAYFVAKQTGKVIRNTDSPKGRDALSKAIEPIRAEYEAWLRDTFAKNIERKLFKGFTNAGNRRYADYTIENVLAEMRKQQREEGGESSFYGAGSIRAKVAKKYKSIPEIQKDRGRLVTREEMEKSKGEFNNRLQEIAEKGRDAFEGVSGRDFGYSERFWSAVFDAKQRGRKYVADAYKVDVNEMPWEEIDSFLNELKNLPTEYFEAKINREVGIGEFSGAVVPTETPQDVIDILAKHGVTEVERYKKGDEKDRARAMKALADRQGILFQSAYHGSPHTFDKFSMSKIGTGEGAQAYGHGLYFAGNKEVAEHYKKVLSGNSYTFRGRGYNSLNRNEKNLVEQFVGHTETGHMTPDEAVWQVRDNAQKTLEIATKNLAEAKKKLGTTEDGGEGWGSIRYFTYDDEVIQNQEQTVESAREFKRAADDLTPDDIKKATGRLYHVDLKPAEDEYLLWDRPLSEQSEKVRMAIAGAGVDVSHALGHRSGEVLKKVEPTGEQIYRRVASQGPKVGGKWGDLPDAMGERGASEYLKSLGIRGIKYLDGSSRNWRIVAANESRTGKWTVGPSNGDTGTQRYFDTEKEAKAYYDSKVNTNYVLFDDADVEITRMEQAQKGAIQFRKDGRAIIHAFEAADVSTMLHELGHLFRRDLSGEDAEIAAKWAGAKDGKWDRPAEEKFARGFENYLRSGKAQNSKIKAVFEQFKQWLTAIYQTIKGSDIDVKVPDEMVRVYDRLFGSDKPSPSLTQSTTASAQESGKSGEESGKTLTGDVITPALIDAARRSGEELRKEVTNVRYGDPGEIRFEFKGETYTAPEPRDILPVGDGEASKAWAVKQVLSGDAKVVAGGKSGTNAETKRTQRAEDPNPPDARTPRKELLAELRTSKSFDERGDRVVVGRGPDTMLVPWEKVKHPRLRRLVIEQRAAARTNAKIADSQPVYDRLVKIGEEAGSRWRTVFAETARNVGVSDVLPEGTRNEVAAAISQKMQDKGIGVEALGTPNAPKKSEVSGSSSNFGIPADKMDTPAIRQFVRFKKSHPGALLLLRIGDFYELFGDDARTVSKEIGLVLVERSGIPMAGIPHHQLEQYLKKMTENGHRVAVAEPIDPKSIKAGTEVTRVITPGTLVDDGEVAPKSNGTRTEGAQEAAKVAGAPYATRVEANLNFIGTPKSEWSAVAVKGMADATDDKGNARKMPEFDFPKDYKQIQTLFRGEDECHLCGTPIKHVFWIQNDTKKLTMKVGSECVTNFGEGKSGAKLSQESQWAANRDFVRTIHATLDRVKDEYPKGGTLQYVYKELNELSDSVGAEKSWHRAESSDATLTRWVGKNGEKARQLLDTIKAHEESDKGRDEKIKNLEAKIRRTQGHLNAGYERRMEVYPFTTYPLQERDRKRMTADIERWKGLIEQAKSNPTRTEVTTESAQETETPAANNPPKESPNVETTSEADASDGSPAGQAAGVVSEAPERTESLFISDEHGPPVESTDLDPSDKADANRIVKAYQKWHERGESATPLDTASKAAVDAAYRTLSTEITVPGQGDNVRLFALPEHEDDIRAAGKKMAGIKDLGKLSIPDPSRLPPLSFPAGRPVESVPVAKKTAQRIKSIEPITSKEAGRYSFTGVLVADGGKTLVATDGRRLSILRGEKGEFGEKSGVFEIGKDGLGKPMEGNFPPYQDVIPDYSRADLAGKSAKVDATKIRRDAQKVAVMTDEENKGVVVVLNKNGTIGFAGAAEGGMAEVNVHDGYTELGHANPAFIADAMELAERNGDQSVEFQFPKPNKPMVVKGERTTSVIMPVNLKEEFRTGDAVGAMREKSDRFAKIGKARQNEEALSLLRTIDSKDGKIADQVASALDGTESAQTLEDAATRAENGDWNASVLGSKRAYISSSEGETVAKLLRKAAKEKFETKKKPATTESKRKDATIPPGGNGLPWDNSTFADEHKWYGTRVKVAPELKGEEAWSGAVERVFNEGRLVEVRPDGVDTTFRVPSSRITLEDAAGPTSAPSGPNRSRFTDRLDERIDEIRSRRNRRQLPRGRNIGAGVLGSEIRDAATIAFLQAVKAGAIAGRALTKAVAAALKSYNSKADPKKVRSVVRGLIKDAGIVAGQTPDMDRVDRAIADLRTQTRKPAQSTKQTIAQNAGPTAKGEPEFTAAETEKIKYGYAAKAAKQSFREGQQDQVRTFQTETLPKIRHKMMLDSLARQGAAFKAGENAGAEEAKFAREQVRGIRKTLVDEIRQLPPAVRGKFLTHLRDVKTYDQLRAALDAIERESLVFGSGTHIRQAAKMGKDASLLKLPEEDENGNPVRSEVRKWLADAAAQWEELQKEQERHAKGPGVIKGEKPDARRKRRYEHSQRSLAKIRQLAADIKANVDAAREQFHYEKRKFSAYVKGQKVQAAVTRRAMVDSAKANQKPLKESDVTDATKPFVLRRLIRYSIPIASLAKRIDMAWKGDGTWYNVLVQNFTDSNRKKNFRYREIAEASEKVAEAAGYKSMSDAHARLSGTYGKKYQEMVTVEIGGKKRRIPKGAAMDLWAHATDASTSELLANGQTINFRRNKMADDQTVNVASVYHALTPQERAFVEQMKAVKDTMFAEMDATNRRLKGTSLDRQPGHWSRTRNSKMSEKIGQTDVYRNTSDFHLDNSGFLKQRTGGRVPIIIGDFLEGWHRQTNAMMQFTYLSEPVRWAEQLALHPDVKPTIVSLYGEQMIRRIERGITDASGTSPFIDLAWHQRFIRSVTARVGRALTSVNWRSWAKNLGGTLKIMGKMPMDAWRHGVQGMFKKGVLTRMMKYSADFWHRWNSSPHSRHTGVMDSADALEGGHFVEGAKKTIGNLFSLDLMGADAALQQTLNTIKVSNAFDSVPARVAWAGWEWQVEQDHPTWSHEQKMEWVANEAWKSFSESQNTTGALDSSAAFSESRRDPFYGALMQFTSDSSKSLAMLYDAAHQGAGEKAKTAAAITLNAAWATAVVGVSGKLLWSAIAAMMGGEPDWEDAEKQAAEGSLWQAKQEVANVFPLVGPAVEKIRAVSAPFRRSSVMDNPAAGSMDDLLDGLAELAVAPFHEQRIKKNGVPYANSKTAFDKIWSATYKTLRAAATVEGIPVSPFVRDIKGVVDAYSSGRR